MLAGNGEKEEKRAWIEHLVIWPVDLNLCYFKGIILKFKTVYGNITAYRIALVKVNLHKYGKSSNPIPEVHFAGCGFTSLAGG